MLLSCLGTGGPPIECLAYGSMSGLFTGSITCCEVLSILVLGVSGLRSDLDDFFLTMTSF